MKKSKMNLKLMAILFAVFVFVSMDAYAQRPGRGFRNNAGQCDGYGPGRGYGNGNAAQGYGMGNAAYANIPSLTADQLSSIESLRTPHLKKMQTLRAKLQEEQARLNTLRVEGSDEKAINSSIDKLTTMRGDLMKERESHRRQIRALLTEDQKTWFDARPGCRYYGNASGNRPYGRGNGAGWRNQSNWNDMDD
ncbi:MAG: Spy/CpxP family protein refolding chaperone [Lentimicrobium sp.]|jgi:Spy/CpxP family protein refolding chaperone|nr:Spy/CpxP family protein refolding chaperone [Lentimicrobium sp.]